MDQQSLQTKGPSFIDVVDEQTHQPHLNPSTSTPPLEDEKYFEPKFTAVMLSTAFQIKLGSEGANLTTGLTKSRIRESQITKSPPAVSRFIKPESPCQYCTPPSAIEPGSILELTERPSLIKEPHQATGGHYQSKSKLKTLAEVRLKREQGSTSSFALVHNKSVLKNMERQPSVQGSHFRQTQLEYEDAEFDRFNEDLETMVQYRERDIQRYKRPPSVKLTFRPVPDEIPQAFKEVQRIMEKSSRGTTNPIQQSLLLLSKQTLHMSVPQEQLKFAMGTTSSSPLSKQRQHRQVSDRMLESPSKSRQYVSSPTQRLARNNVVGHYQTQPNSASSPSYNRKSNSSISQESPPFLESAVRQILSARKQDPRYQIAAPRDTTTLTRKLLQKGAYKDSLLSPSKLTHLSPVTLSTSKPQTLLGSTQQLVSTHNYKSICSGRPQSGISKVLPSPISSQQRLKRPTPLMNSYDLKFVYSPRSFPASSKNPNIYLGSRDLNEDILKPSAARQTKLVTQGRLQDTGVIRHLPLAERSLRYAYSPQINIATSRRNDSSQPKGVTSQTKRSFQSRPPTTSSSSNNKASKRNLLAHQNSQKRIAKSIKIKQRYVV